MVEVFKMPDATQALIDNVIKTSEAVGQAVCSTRNNMSELRELRAVQETAIKALTERIRFWEFMDRSRYGDPTTLPKAQGIPYPNGIRPNFVERT